MYCCTQGVYRHCCTTCCEQVTETTATDVICEARNDAVLGGLLTVFHTERSSSSLNNMQNDLPVCAPHLLQACNKMMTVSACEEQRSCNLHQDVRECARPPSCDGGTVSAANLA